MHEELPESLEEESELFIVHVGLGGCVMSSLKLLKTYFQLKLMMWQLD